MSAWSPANTAPKDRPVLLYGKLTQATPERPQGAIRVVGYWDEIDGAWALTSTTWAGPFFKPTHWAELPAVPDGAA